MRRNRTNVHVRGNLRLRLVALVAAAAAPGLLLASYAAATERSDDIRNARSATLTASREAARHERMVIDEARALMETLALVPAVQTGDASACGGFLADLVAASSLFQDVALVLPDGQVACSSRPGPDAASLAGKWPVGRAREDGAFTVGDVDTSVVTRQPRVVIALPAGPGKPSRPVLAATAALLAPDLDDLLATLPSRARLTITDGIGTVLGRLPARTSDPVEIGAIYPDTDITQAIRTHRREGVVEGRSFSGEKRVLGYTRVTDAGASAYVVVSVPRSAVLADSNRAARRLLVAAAATTLSVLLVAVLGGDLLVLGLVRRITAVTRRLAAGDHAVRVGPTRLGGEVGELARSVDALAQALDEHEAEAARANAEAARHTTRLEVLSTVSDRLAEHALDVEDVLDVVAHQTARLLSAWCAIRLLSDDGSELVTAAVRHSDPEIERRVRAAISASEPESDTPGRRVLEGSRPFLSAMRRRDRSSPREPDAVPSAGDQPSVTVPMRSRGATLGWLSIGRFGGGAPFSDDDLDLVQELAHRGAVATDNARLFAHTRELLAHITSVEEEERRRIAADIHDDTIQALVAATYGAAALRRTLPDGALDEQFRRFEAELEAATRRLRTLMFELHPPAVEGGLGNAIDAYVGEALRDTQIEWEVDDRLPSPPPPDTAALLYRTAREAITNVRRHAHASRAVVSLRRRGHEYVLEVSDDGTGMTGAPVSPPGHLGLTAMHERVRAAGGRLAIASEPGQGTRVTCVVPAARAGRS